MRDTRRLSIGAILLSMVALVFYFSSSRLPAAEVRYRADIQIRDPFILPVAETKTYYMVDKMAVRLEEGSTRQGVGVYTSKDLERWEGPKPVFHYPDGFWIDGNIWAPEMHRYRGKYYVFATFNSKGRLVMPIHQPNEGKIRARLFEIEDAGVTLRIKREIPFKKPKPNERTIPQ